MSGVSPKNGITLEVCVESLESAKSAFDSGCDRLELCVNLAVGGTTPPHELVENVLQLVSCPVIVLIRCRPGDFLFDDSEQTAMLHTAEKIVSQGVAGIAVGATRGGQWDLPLMRGMARFAGHCDLVAHRAMDQLVGPAPTTIARLAELVQPLIDLGYKRILTSGGYQDALQGSYNICKIIEYSAGRIEVLPGGGVTPDNAAAILVKTKVTQLHGSFKRSPQRGLKVEFDSCRLKELFSAIKLTK